ncbi:MAG: DNA polymerase I, partial [Chloroflexaceae bacterium]|nr:DNA polymerase I [Chloroflexaceae bacterium]
MSERKQLALIDGHALAFRAFHALREAGLRSSSGEPTYAVFGFAQILLTMIQEQHPAYVAVSFDIGRTFRDDMYPDYKAGRSETPEEFHPQLDRIKELVAAFNIPVYTAEGFEADDVIGTLSRQAEAQGVNTLILTGDTDTLQLVNAHVRVLLANPYGQKTTTTVYDQPKVEERYEGLKPNQLADLRGLKGDTSDNIPGVKGIGEKGAINLLNQFGSVENLFDHLDEVPNRYRKVLDGQRDAALFSKKLATIVCDAPVSLNLADARLEQYDRSAVIRLFQELEFGATSGLLKKLPSVGEGVTAQPLPPVLPPAPKPGEAQQQDMFAVPLPVEQSAVPAGGTLQLALFDLPNQAAGQAAAPIVTSHMANIPTFGDYRTVDTEEALDDLVNTLNASPAFAFDTEATGVRPFASEIVGISIAVRPGTAYYIPIGHRAGQQLPRQLVLDRLRPFFSDPQQQRYAHNAKFDMEVLTQAGVEVPGVAFDTMIAAGLLGKTMALKGLSFYELKLPEPMTD